MKRILKWTGIVLGSIALLLLLAIGAIYIITNNTILNKTYQPDESAFEISASQITETDLKEGERLVNITGCNGCHGKEFQGGVFLDIPFMFKAVAPNLTQICNSYSDTQLEQAIRQGLRPDGTSNFAMPSSMYYHLSDDHLTKIIAAIRTKPVIDGFPESEITLGILPRVMMVAGKMDYKGQHPIIKEMGTRLGPADTSNLMNLGEYMARIACTECHGQNFAGAQLSKTMTPNLAMVAGYPLEDFTILMREGITLSKVSNDMSNVALERFKYLTDQEIEAIHTFLSTLAQNPVAG